MKKLLLSLFGVATAIGIVSLTNAQIGGSQIGSPNFFKLVGSVITPINPAWSVSTGGSSATSTFGFITATTTTATSSFAGNVSVARNTTLASTTVNGTLTVNGTIVPRVVGYTASTSITINVDTTDIASTTVAHATTTFNTPSGTLYDGMMFEMWLRATTTRGLAWSTGFASSTDLALPTSVASGTTKVLLEYRVNSAKWELNGLIAGFAN